MIGTFGILTENHTKIIKEPFEYSDKLLSNSVNTISPELIKFLIAPALSASLEEMLVKVFDQIGFTYINKINEVEEKLNYLAGDKITDSIYYPAQVIDNKPYYNSIAFGIANKKINQTETILLAIRGGNYGLEWGGDFNTGDKEIHQGFKIASDQVIEGLKEFIKNKNLKPPYKIYLTGYSRAAAVANLTAQRLSVKEIEGFNRENTQAVTFECPRISRGDIGDFDNIFNIVNPDDLIPMIPPSAWGFQRFGKDLLIPCAYTSKNFKELFKKREDFFNQLDLKPVKIEEKLSINITRFVNDFAYVLGSPENYVKKYQESLIKIAAFYMGGYTDLSLDSKDFSSFAILEKRLFEVNPINSELVLKELSMTGHLSEIALNSPIFNVHHMTVTYSWVAILNNIKEYLNKYCWVVIDRIPAKLKGFLYNDQILIKNSSFLYLYLFNLSSQRPEKIYYYRNLEKTKEYLLNLAKNPVLKNEEIIKETFKTDNQKLFLLKTETKGEGILIGGGYYFQEEPAILEASGKNGFKGFFEDNKLLSRFPIITININRNQTILAKFS